ncbi:uncharacterized protein LOC108623099 [Ceratina calcarata]|uniref:Uncharacterized protein LOC108623099 n=1 Tax=Ceratina calcarata TaxID=156304 RepID=A0AAJ7IUD0_9HYME|nr:uncharacterized protein LOC108623099 [Ceratina calcarata]
MLASLIPFFLVARIAVDESAWEHGPEYVFDVEWNSTRHSSSPDGIHLTESATTKLYCRPTGSDGLNCHLEVNKELDMMRKNKVDIPEEDKRDIAADPFEIKFNDRGVDHMIVNDQIHVYELNNMKLIVERFSIGTDLNGLPDGTYDIIENSTIGCCNGTITINHYPSKRMMNKIKNDRYELESLPQLNKVPSETIMIQKTIKLDNCNNYACFYFGSYSKKVIEPDLQSHLASVSSRIFVSDYQFVSTMIRTGTFGSSDKKSVVEISQHITVSLQDIRAAKGDLPKVPNAAKTSILANAEMERISPEE